MALRSRSLVLAASALLAACGTKEAADPLAPNPFGRVRYVNLITDATRCR